MTVAEFLEWSGDQPDDYELVDGEVVAMSKDRKGHNRTKARAFRALDDAVARAKLSCTTYTDGVAVVTPGNVVRRPDASVECDREFDSDGLVLDNPVIVVEVVSKSSERDDFESKFTDYFSIPSIVHYLIVLPDKRMVLHHQRSGQGVDGPTVLSAIRQSGELRLDPPGLVLTVEELFAPELAAGV